METRLFSHFLEVVRAGSFAAAARSLDLDPSLVSRSISQLETQLGARLFQRTTRSLTLTEAGQRFRARIEGVMGELDAIRDDIRSEANAPEGRLCISASVAFGHTCLIPALDTFLTRYPMIQLDLKLSDSMLDLVAHRIDLSIRLAPSLDGDMIASKLMPTQYHVCASPAYLDGLNTVPETPDQLNMLDAICFDLPDFRSRWWFRDGSGEVVAQPVTPKMIISNALAIQEAARRGLGIALLADWQIKADLEEGRLVTLFPDYAVTATDFDTAAWLVYPSRSFLPRKTRLAIDFLREAIGR